MDLFGMATGSCSCVETLTHDFDRWIEFYRDNGAPEKMTAGFKEVRRHSRTLGIVFQKLSNVYRTAKK